MKVKYLICLAVVMLANVEVKGQGFYLGMKWGFGVSSLESESASVIDLSSRLSPNIAFVLSSQFGKSQFGFSFEPGYILKGTKIDDDALDYRFNYLSMPLLLDFHPSKRLKVSAGPEFSYLLTSKNRLNDSTKVKFQNIYNKNWDVSGAIGVSYSLDYFVDIGVRYNRSFTKEKRLDPVLDTRNLYHQYFQIFLLWKIAN